MDQAEVNICRFCLTEKIETLDVVFINIFECKNNMIEIIEDCLTLKVMENDTLPKTICSKCMENLIQFKSFKDNCLRSEIQLKSKTVNVTNYLNDHDYFQVVNTNILTENNENNKNFGNFVFTQTDNKSEENKSISTLIAKKNERKSVEIVFKIKIYKVDESMRQIIGENTYVCEICSTKFDTFSEYFEHQNTHDGQFVFRCNKCDKVFNKRIDLVNHDNRHKIQCEICKLEVLPKSLPAHLLIHTDKHKCPHCGLRNVSNAALEKHIQAIHAGIKGFVCHICGKQNSCQSSMNRHMAYHSNERPYKCKHCDFSAKSLNIVQVHTSRKHFAEKRVCEICAKIFKSQPSLVQHMKRIHTKRKHICEICNKTFIEKYNLTKHMKKHVGQRLYECKVCHKDFFTVRKLKEHMHSHRQGCVSCPKCNKIFFYKKYFNKHVLKCDNTIH